MHALRSILRGHSQFLPGVVLVAITLVLPAALFGQAYFGTVSGELTDATGAVVQGAKVVLTDQQKGFTLQDDIRQQRALSVPLDSAGIYTVVGRGQGF